MTFSICIDIGGTFTDAVVLERGGAPRLFKAASTPPAFQNGFMAVLESAAEAYGLDLRTFLGRTDSIVHGTTVSTNALVENKVGRCGLMVTAGHPDILLLREGPRKRTFDWSVPYPDAFVPPHLTREIRGRIDATAHLWIWERRDQALQII
jgi:N-methylhydantoinase A